MPTTASLAKHTAARPRMLVALFFVCAFVAGGCSSSGSAMRDDIEGDDGAFFPGVRLRFGPRAHDGAGGAFQAALEAGVEFGDGGFRQSVAPGQIVELDDVRVTGPAELDVEFELLRTFLGVRGSRTQDNGVTGSLLFGLSVTDLDIEASAAGLPDKDDIVGLGFVIGLGAAVEATPSLDVFAEFSLTPQIAGARDSVSLLTFDLGLAADLAGGSGLAAGWRYWRYKADSDPDDGFFFGSNESDLDLELVGPFVSLRLGN